MVDSIDGEGVGRRMVGDKVRDVAVEQGTEGFVGHYSDFGFYAL